MLFDTHSRVQKLLGVELPDDAADLHYYKWQPSSELSYYTAYVKFRVSVPEFMKLVERMQALMEKSAYLPAAWDAEPGVHLDWWDPEPGTPRESGAKQFGLNGWIFAKHERGNAYLIVTDTDRAEVGDEPDR